MAQALLEVLVRHPGDVAGADEGGADRLHLVGDGDLSPEPALVSAVCRETELPVHVRLRLNDTWTTNGGELARLVGLAEDFLRCGATGLSFGFLDPDLRIDAEVTTHVATRIGQATAGVPWVFHRGFDDALEPERAWATVLELPGLVGVQSAGSQGTAVGGRQEAASLAQAVGSDGRSTAASGTS